MIDRPLYLEKLFSWKDKDVIKVITGIRRCGKSKILESYAEKLIKSGISKDAIIQINFEDKKNDKFTADTLNEYLEQKISANQGNSIYIFLDEIQKVEKWETVVASIRLKKNVDIYITGSNAYMLSSELATFLSGRYVEIKMLPLSFAEFLSFHTFPNDMSVDAKFQLYMKFGGMPSLMECNFDEQQCIDILDGIYNTVVVKDVLMHNPNENTATVEKISSYLADNIGNITSINSITNTLFSEKLIEKKNNSFVEDYITSFEKAFIFYSIKRYDIKGKDYLRSLGKYYISDVGFRYYKLGRITDVGRIIENIVYFELLRRGYKVGIGKIDNKEVDFVAIKQDKKIYIQVTETLAGENTRERELSSLLAIKDNFEKIVLTTDRLFSGYTEEGIRIANLIDWLLNK